MVNGYVLLNIRLAVQRLPNKFHHAANMKYILLVAELVYEAYGEEVGLASERLYEKKTNLY